MSQLSSTVPCRIGDVYLTRDATAATKPLRATFDTSDWIPVLSNVAEVLGGAESQRYDIGGPDGTDNFPIQLTIPRCPDVVYAALKAQALDLDAEYDAEFTLAMTDANGDEIALSFSVVTWAEIKHDPTKFFGARLYPDAKLSLLSEA